MSLEDRAVEYIDSKPGWQFDYVTIGPGTYTAGRVTTPSGKRVTFQGASDAAEWVAEEHGEPLEPWSSWRDEGPGYIC